MRKREKRKTLFGLRPAFAGLSLTVHGVSAASLRVRGNGLVRLHGNRYRPLAEFSVCTDTFAELTAPCFRPKKRTPFG